MIRRWICHFGEVKNHPCMAKAVISLTAMIWFFNWCAKHQLWARSLPVSRHIWSPPKLRVWGPSQRKRPGVWPSIFLKQAIDGYRLPQSALNSSWFFTLQVFRNRASQKGTPNLAGKRLDFSLQAQVVQKRICRPSTVHHINQHLRALQMPQELVSEAFTWIG